eukprot:scaffold1184_cov132-Cylindrotheca_fusiformis.AAC.5
MVYLRQLNFILAFALLLQCSAFQISQKNVASRRLESRILPTKASHLFGNTRPRSLRIYMKDDPKDPDDTETQNVEEIKKGDGKKVEEKRTRTVLLTIPLFCKFVIVLLIKFVTDLIVFPLLFLYRLVGLGKRKFLNAIGKGDKHEKTNGEA